jgi:hypothetical protein
MTPTAWPSVRAPDQRAEGRFDVADLDQLPDRARAFLARALAPGAELPERIRLEMHGQIKVSVWIPFTAVETLDAEHGFRWEAWAAGGAVTGYDMLDDAQARSRFRAGPATIVDAAGPDVARSAAGRMVGELAAWMPGQLLPGRGVHWSQTAEGQAVAFVPFAGTYHRLAITLGADDRLRSVTFPRWGPIHHRYDWIPFGLQALDHTSVGGVTIVSRGRVGWWYGTPRWRHGEFFRFAIDNVTVGG